MLSAAQQQLIKITLDKYQPSLLGIFGSYARGEEKPNSDLDILVNFESKVNLLELISLEQELSALLGIKVDLVTVNAINKLLKPYIEKDLIRII